MESVSYTELAYQLLTDSLLNCTNGPLKIPASSIFLANLSPSFLLAILCASILCLVTICLGFVHVMYIGYYVTHPYRRAFLLYLAGTAPFVSCFALVSMYMPRIWFLAHLLSFFYFSIALYFVICLLMNLAEGRQQVIRMITSKSNKISIATPPLCCVFPCLPTLEAESRKIKICELMVLQNPVIRLFVTIISLILYFEYHEPAVIAIKVLDYVFLPSLLLGVYGCHILVTTVSKLDEFISYRYIVVFRLLNIYFMIFGAQQPLFYFLARVGYFECGTLLPPLETSIGFWKNFATVFESFWIAVISTILLKPSKSAIFDKYKSPSCSSPSGIRMTSLSFMESALSSAQEERLL